jgi:ADP-ribosylation factor protein 1
MGAGLGKSDVRVLIAGLDSAGKTTVLQKVKRGEKRLAENISTTPTMHFNVEQWKYKGRTFSVWDVGGQDAIRPLWRHHLIGTQALVYVVDSNDRERLQKAAEELHRVMLDHSMRKACLLVYANKCDLPHALTAEQVRDELKLEQLGARAWHVQKACATSGEGLWAGLKWLAAHVKPV